ncbi:MULTISPECIES: SRPBCC domain-containing protein [unclassified Micromonospora]|uniref:SRPBCC family protein n=1 Tax=unclassified Micromonospora TaxID=2617518 RepID=UPI001C23A02E|nr:MULTISPECIES: SRPBCC domain-containing protein [unclassified Micromonospora]MBU8861423.1 SRPBCC domain-containing protein [Micromonospora sp. WMMB482]MDM4780985.1 SRPBCC domain-containing protein [Micromonospora sp. b486]
MTLHMRVTRHLPGTPDEAFDAYTDAGKQKIWFGILDEEPGVVEIDVDLRVGGRQTAVWGPSPDELFRETQTFLEIDRPHRLVTESTGTGPVGTTMTTRIEVTFEAKDGGTLITVVQSGFPTPQLRDLFVGEVWAGAFARIEAYLIREQAEETSRG